MVTLNQNEFIASVVNLLVKTKVNNTYEVRGNLSFRLRKNTQQSQNCVQNYIPLRIKHNPGYDYS